ncbi:hypothetical protein N7448_004881 [Penicillium atrosanguineum]|uniref:Uncharacterized protein n=1 Tax=Penicillium atrosanguineum TaxID=1132637 RepID=A0A9W9U1I8_9EURO|nr:hypothetical protein N7448_004881 [Penicillium atrosanguineum]KAJ5303299.1 hypothetical protein N7476_010098 [Penicillium atrosanguineum]
MGKDASFAPGKLTPLSTLLPLGLWSGLEARDSAVSRDSDEKDGDEMKRKANRARPRLLN